MPSTRAFHRAQAGLVRGASAVLGRLPVGAAYALADAASLGLLAWSAAHERRVAPLGRGLRRNQRIVFRDALSPELSRRLERAWARHLARLAVDGARLARLSSASLTEAVDLPCLTALEEVLAEGRGMIGVTGHIGVWEILAHLPRLTGIPVTVVARSRRSPVADALLSGERRRGGARSIPQRGALWTLKRALERGEVVGLLADENVRVRPVFAPFLGTVAASSPSAAFLQRLTGAPIVVVACHRTGTGRFAVEAWDVIRRPRGGSSEAQLQQVTRAVNDALSRAILAQPDQWLWGSRRFETRPPGEAPGPDGLPPRGPRAAEPA